MGSVGRVAGLVTAWLGLGLLTLWLMGFGPPGLRLSDLPLPNWRLDSAPQPPVQAADTPGAAPGTAPATIPGATYLAVPDLSGPTGPAFILDVDAVPFVGAAGRDAYRTWLTLNLPRVFVVAPNGSNAWVAGGDKPLDEMRTRALDRCAADGTKGCAVYAENLSIAWPSRPWTPPPPPGPLITGAGYAFVPDARYIWRGPQSGRGVYVWGHGTGGVTVDARGHQPQPHVRPFNNAGFDVVRFDRAPATDYPERAAAWLRDGLLALRARGYSTIIVGGQSRGAWNALQMLDTPGAADAVIAIAPAAHGIRGGVNRQEYQIGDLRRIMDHMEPNRTRVAVVQFADDPFAADSEWRAEVFDINALHLGGLLLIDRPDGFTGHFGGEEFKFGQLYGPCLLRFVLDQPSACPR